MKIVYIGLILLFLIVLASFKGMINASQWSGSALKMAGFKSKEEIQKDLLDKFIIENLRSQLTYLQNTKEQMGSLSETIEYMSKYNRHVDILRLKDLMQQFENQNVLLIEDGEQLMDMYEKQKKKRLKEANQFNITMMLASMNRKQYMDNIRADLATKKELIRQQIQDGEILKSKAFNIQNQISQMHDNVTLNANQKFVEELQSLTQKTSTFLDDMRLAQERLIVKNDVVDDKKEDLDERAKALRRRTKEINENLKDQIDNLKERQKDKK